MSAKLQFPALTDMPVQLKPERRLEIAHVLFIDVVGYSRLLVGEQRDVVQELNEIVRETPEFRASEAMGKLIRIPTGDGMALVFFESPEEPVQCAIEIARTLRDHPQIRIRMGVHSGPVDEITHVDNRANVAGAGINIAQRVMDCGDAGHILLSRRVAEDLEQDARWQPHLHDLGEVETKHGAKVGLVNFYTDDIGNSALPTKLRQQRQQTHRRRNVMMLAAAAVILGIIIALFAMPRASARKIDKSIAVLPFESLSDEKENAYFADGIQDDILTNLSKIGDLKVISRTSVLQYRGKPTNVREIGKALGVSNVLEGSVRRSGNKVRVNVQLIDANTDEHIWANDYDRDITDVFAIQSDLAQSIAEALQARLSPGEKSQMTRKPTENGEAYLAFVQAHNLSCNFEDFEKLKQSEQLYQRAIDLDPNFALAIARYSQLQSWIQHTFDPAAKRREKARTLAERALELQPDLPEGHLALGCSYYYGDNNYDAALEEFETAQRGLPNESEMYLYLGAIQRRQGRWADSTANLEKAVSLNPKDVWQLQNLAFNYQMQRNYSKANEIMDRALELNPTSVELLGVKSKLAIAEKGDFSVAEKAFETVKSAPMTDAQKLNVAAERANVFLLERKYQDGLDTAEQLPDDQLASFPGALWSKYYYIGFARTALGDESGASAAFARAKRAAEDELKISPGAAKLHIQLAKALAHLGDKNAALAEAQQASELDPESKDAFDGPEITEGVAEVQTIVGENDRAIELLDGLLSRPANLTVQALRINPIWDPLRNDPRFQALLVKYGGEA
jgi:serine/threonine-protein kinase